MTVVYGSSVLDSTLATASKMATTTGGTETSKTTVLTGGNHFGEVWSQGNASLATVTAIPGTPTGRGWVWDKPGAGSFATGNWSASIGLSGLNGEPVTMHIRFFRYSSGTYTSIGSINASVTLSSSRATVSFSATSMSTITFGSSDLLYVDLWLEDTTGAGGDSPVIYISNSATAGVANDMQVTTSTFTTSGTQANKSTGLRLRMSTLARKSAGIRLRMSGKTTKSTGLRLRLAGQRKKSVGLRLLLVAFTHKSTGLRLRLAGQSKQSVGLRFNLLALNKNAYTVVIGNQAMMVVQGTLSVQQTIGKRAQASFTIYNPSTSIHIQQYQAVSMWDQNGNLAFTGYVTSPKEQKPGFSNSLLTQITATDQHYLADKRRVAKVYAGRTRSLIVQDILNTILAQEGVTLGAIVTEDANVATLYPSTTLHPSSTLYPIGSSAGLVNATFIYAKVSEALDAITKDASQSGVPYYWTIDKNKRFFWVPYTYSINPNVVDGTTIDQVYSPSYLTRANSLYMNTIYILGGVNKTSQQTETRAGDGSTRSWAMGYALASAPTIRVDAAPQSVGIKGIDTGKQFYWQQGDTTITQDSSQTVLTSSNTLSIVYIGQYPITTTAKSDAQISTQASLDLTSGIVEDIEVDATLTTADDGLSKATGLISRNAVQGLLFEYSTQDSTYTPGEMRTYNYAPHGLSNVQMIVESVTASDQQDGINIWYAIKSVYGPYDQTWQDFFSSIISAQEQTQAISAGVQGIIQSTQTFTAALTLSASATATIGTAATLYGSNVLSGLLSSTSLLSATTGGTETSVLTHISGGGHFGEATSRGGTVTAVSSIPATPTGNGWVYQPGSSTSPAGNWSANVTVSFADWQSGNQLTIRFFKHSGTTYTSIGTITANVTGKAKATYSFGSTGFSSVTFGSSDLLYVDLWLFDSSGTGGDNPTIFLSNNGSAGVANDLQIITPGL